MAEWASFYVIVASSSSALIGMQFIWVWYAALPCAGYAMLAIGAVILAVRSPVGAGVIAGSVLALLIVGIHNAWDTVVHIMIPDGIQAGTDEGDPSRGASE